MEALTLVSSVTKPCLNSGDRFSAQQLTQKLHHLNQKSNFSSVVLKSLQKFNFLNQDKMFLYFRSLLMVSNWKNGVLLLDTAFVY